MFIDREDAAQQLARQLAELPLHDPIVLAIPRGGVVTGAVLAKDLNADLDVILARKLRSPFQPELAIGALGVYGSLYLNRAAATAAGVDESFLASEQRRQQAAIDERRQRFRGGRSCAPLTGRSVILTDDGIATGSTMLAALHVVNALDPREVIVAVPVAPTERLAAVRAHCDRLVCLIADDDFQSVGQYYQGFTQVEDEDVATLLKQSQHAPARPR
jgi:putative phosphoribosyl transferase